MVLGVQILKHLRGVIKLYISDKCVGVTGYRNFSDPDNCRGYWECIGSRAIPYCCALGYRYDGTLNRCVVDQNHSCRARCVTDGISKLQGKK